MEMVEIRLAGNRMGKSWSMLESAADLEGDVDSRIEEGVVEIVDGEVRRASEVLGAGSYAP